MEADPVRRYALDHDGRLLVVEVGTEQAANVARLLVDGDEAARGRTWRVGAVTLRHDDLSVAVSWWWTGRVRSCDLVEKPAEGSGRPHRTMLEPPPDSRAHRLWVLQQQKPGLYASRHVVIAVAQVLATLLGIGALLTALLPHVDLSWVPVPDLDIGKPSWWPEFSLWGWVPDLLPDLEVPDWVRTVLKSAKFWVPVLIAIGVASQEYERRKKKSKETSNQKGTEEPADDET